MSIVTRRIATRSLKPAPYNPRKPLRPGDAEYDRLLKSVERFGVVELLVWNKRTGHLVSGHQRLAILTARGATHVDVVVVDLPLTEEKALNLALNKIDGQWDTDRLAGVLDELLAEGTTDLDCTGFSGAEIDQLTAGLLDGVEEQSLEVEPTDEDQPVVTRPGDLIEIGHHRILCADMTDPAALARLLGQERAHLVFTDPPYNVAYNSRNRPMASVSHEGSRPIRNDRMTPRRYRAWFKKVISVLQEQMLPGASYYLWNGHANFGLMSDLLTEAGMRPRQVITWAKESFAPGFGDYNEQTEFCLYGCRGGGRRRWYGPKNASTLWNVSRDRTTAYAHPTQKALPLAERAIRHSSKRGDLVLDPFLGSGTALVAAARLGRRCFGVEIEPRYVDVAVRRYIATAGRSAVSAEIADRYQTEPSTPAPGSSAPAPGSHTSGSSGTPEIPVVSECRVDARLDTPEKGCVP